MKCKICDRETEDEYCVYHSRAYVNIKQQFERWSKALGISWEEYLREVMKNEYTGVWAKDIASHLLSTKKFNSMNIWGNFKR